MQAQARFIGSCQQVKEGMIVGWAINAAAPQEYVIISVFIDNQKITDLVCDHDREDIQKLINFFRSDIACEFEIPAKFHDNQPHTIIFRFSDGSIMSFVDPTNPQRQLESWPFKLAKKQAEYLSYIDGWQDGSINGWVLKRDTKNGKYVGNCIVKVLMNGTELKLIKANQYRSDVASAYNGDVYCGFSVFVPFSLRTRYKANFQLFTFPDGVELRGSPYETTLVDDLLEQHLLAVSNRLTILNEEVASLQKQINHLIAHPKYVIDEYYLWAKEYYQLLPAKILLLKQQLKFNQIKEDAPLVSIICPVYKPELQFFEEAVLSVLNQTYQNWELLIVDDGAKSKEIQKRINKFTKLDPRIKSITLKENQGISEATNVGLKHAAGEWVSFFDHDDVLVEQAIEIMLLSAYLFNADILYSDEDKLDSEGNYREPHFKPDFNYRYLLGCNYICHLLMVKAVWIQKVGSLDSQFNGAQDHDYILRLAEIVPHEKIYHVPEVLYHWRKTKSSTAESLEHKGYASEAGVACITQHLKRIKKAAKVSAINKATIYSVIWDKNCSKTVTIIIPFKDQVDLTKECVDRILTKTKYKNYQILLVDNASDKQETTAFIEDYKHYKNISFLHIYETFNFSRLNNLATQHCQSDYYLFLNNDVFVEQSNWLTILVNEAELFDDVAVVGAKLLYPNGKVQHGGVIVGSHLVAEHMGRGLDAGEYGYCGRSAVSQELSAVTAAMMLVKADIFHQVNGFDEDHLKVAYNDVDLCLKIREAGYKVILNNNCTAIHHESLSRGTDDSNEHKDRFRYEVEYMNNKWGNKRIYQRDPAYSPHFAIKSRLFYELTNPVKTEVQKNEK